MALSCTIFNKHKGSDLASIDPETDKLTSLYNPRKEKWQKHFRIEDSQIIALTPEGRVTARLLKFNRNERCEERKLLMGAEVLNPKEI